MVDGQDWKASRKYFGQLIAARLVKAADTMRDQWESSAAEGRIRACWVDDLLPPEIAKGIYAAFPPVSGMMLKRTIRENKHVAAQMDRYDPLLEEIVFAFQVPEVVEQVVRITGLSAMEPDTELYAGGISAMVKGAYLRPHIDNSHDRTRSRYRVLNLLYYVTPEWRETNGGNLQLWDNGPNDEPRTVVNRFNRLVLMATDKGSWHSVNEIQADAVRTCVSNYYFSRQSPASGDYFHATSFRAEHGRGLSDIVMRTDNMLRTAILLMTGDRLYKNPHVYKRDKNGN